MKKYVNLLVCLEKDHFDEADTKFVIEMANEMLAERTFCGFRVSLSEPVEYTRDIRGKPLDCVAIEGCKTDHNCDVHWLENGENRRKFDT